MALVFGSCYWRGIEKVVGPWKWSREGEQLTYGPVLRRAESQLWEQPGHISCWNPFLGLDEQALLFVWRCLLSDSWRWWVYPFHVHSLLAFRHGGFARVPYFRASALPLTSIISTYPLPAALTTPHSNPLIHAYLSHSLSLAECSLLFHYLTLTALLIH